MIDIRNSTTEFEGDEFTAAVKKILASKYPELNYSKGNFYFGYIPVPKEAVSLIGILYKLEDIYFDIDPTRKEIEETIERIIKLYEPVIKRAKEKVTIMKDKQNKRNHIYEKEGKNHLLKTSTLYKSLLKEIKKIESSFKKLDKEDKDQRLAGFDTELLEVIEYLKLRNDRLEEKIFLNKNFRV